MKFFLHNYEAAGVPAAWILFLCIVQLAIFCVYFLLPFDLSLWVVLGGFLFVVALYIFGRYQYAKNIFWLDSFSLIFFRMAPVDENAEMHSRSHGDYEEWIVQRAMRNEIDVDQAAALLDAKAQFDYDVAVQNGGAHKPDEE
jgi:hypothetical protein